MNGINWGNNGLINSPYNFVPQMQQFQTQAPRMEVIRVSGKPGAEAFQIGPNSSVILLDNNDPIIWFVQTDGAGYKTITPYDINVHIDGPSPEIKSMDEKLVAIDKRLIAIEEAMRDESDN